MNLPGFTALSAAWLFLLLVPLVVFYFLKLKRPRMEIPSLALWRQVINDQRVNAPFQKFKRNLLLLLQLLLLVCLVLAAMQPFVQAGPERAEYLPVLIDCSASMGAVDERDGRTRLDAAKDEVRRIIDNLLTGQRVALIAVHSSARRLTEFTDNKRVLRDALRQLEVADVPSRLEDGLRMAQAMAQTEPIETVLFFTDGNVPPQVDFDLPFVLNYQVLPAAGANIGITAFNARRSGPDRWDVFLRVEGGTAGQVAADVELLQDGEPVGTDTVVLEPGGAQRVVFRVRAGEPSRLEARLKPEGFDALASDNVAYLDLPAQRPLLAYCSLDLETYRHALAAQEGLVLYPNEDDGRRPASYDLLVSDRMEGTPEEAAVALYVGVVPPDLQSLLTIQTGLSEPVDWRRTEPLLQHVQLADVQTADQPIHSPGAGERDFEDLGYEVLVHARTGPLLLKRRYGQRVAYYLLFHTDRSTLPYRVGFPILIANLVELAFGQAELSEVRATQTGVVAPRSLRPDRDYQVSGPDGSRHAVRSDADGVLAGVPAPRVGRYRISEGGRTAAEIGASLLSPQETRLESVDELQFRELSVAAAESVLRSDRPLWRTFALLGFGLLMVEWWCFQRRPGGGAG